MNKRTYIARMIDLLRVDDFYGVGIHIDIAKGSNELPLTMKGLVNTVKRNKEYGN